MNQFGKSIGVSAVCLFLGVSIGLFGRASRGGGDHVRLRTPTSTSKQSATNRKIVAEAPPHVADTLANEQAGTSEPPPLGLYQLDEWIEVPSTLLKHGHVPSLHGMLAAGSSTSTNYLSSSGLTKLLKLNAASEEALNKALASAMSGWADSATRRVDGPDQKDAQILQFDVGALARIQGDFDRAISKILSAEQAHVFRARAYRDLQFLFRSERLELKLTADDVEISGKLSNGTTSFTRSNIAGGSPLATLLTKVR